MTKARQQWTWGVVTLVLCVTQGTARFAAQHPAGQHPASQHPAGHHPTGQHPGGQHPAGQHPAGQHPAGTGHGQHGTPKPDESAACAAPTIACATSATPHVAPDGTLWVVWSAAGRVFAARSSDTGRTFGSPMAVTSAPVTIDRGADARPQIVVDREGRVVVGYAVLRGDKYVGQIMISHSADGGRTFSPPRPLSDNPASQRFLSLTLDSSGDIFAAWIDKRHVLEAQRAGQSFSGASVAFAWSRDGGRTFGPATIAHDNSCECCRLAVRFQRPKQPAVLFRNIFDGERDHAIFTLGARGTAGPIRRVSDDHWKIDACPHQGPSLAIGPDGTYHATWFSAGGQRLGLFYARSRDGGRTFSPPMPVGVEDRQPTRPYVLANGDQLWLVWKEFDGGRSTVQAMLSRDDGRTWSAAQLVAGTDGPSDHPLLIARDGQTFLSWLTRAEGYRVIALATTTRARLPLPRAGP